MNRFKPISISLSPNVQKDDAALAFKLLFQPWKWKRGRAVQELEEKFKEYLGVKYAFSFNSGRSSFFAILQALQLQKGSDVLLQAFTCNAVPNPILWAGLNPEYIDCGEDFNVDIEDIKRKITPERKVLVLQHTFGLPADIEQVEVIVRQNNMILIEDCAHALGAQVNGRKIGTFGKAAFFSFARDKVISCVYGGMAVTNDDGIGKKLEELQKESGYPSSWWIFQQIIHPLLLRWIVLPLYAFFDLGKLVLIFSQWLHILSKAVSWKEKRGIRPEYFPKALPNPLALMALNQFNKLEAFNGRRQEIAAKYYEALKDTPFALPKKDGNIFLRFAIRHPRAHEIIYKAWHEKNILLGDWYTTAIAPDDTKMEAMKYVSGSCPQAEKLARETLNLPTHITLSPSDLERVITFINDEQ